jgi:hypothetical protein
MPPLRPATRPPAVFVCVGVCMRGWVGYVCVCVYEREREKRLWTATSYTCIYVCRGQPAPPSPAPLVKLSIPIRNPSFQLLPSHRAAMRDEDPKEAGQAPHELLVQPNCPPWNDGRPCICVYAYVYVCVYLLI